MKLGDATAQLDGMKENAYFDLPTPHKVVNFDSLRFDGWSLDEAGKTLECPVCRNSFKLKVRSQVIPGRKNRPESHVYFAMFWARLSRGHYSYDSDEWAVCSEECEKILQLRLDRMEEQKLREYEELNESRKLQKAGLKLANMEKVPTTLPENNRPVACATVGGATGVQTVPKAKMTPVTKYQP